MNAPELLTVEASDAESQSARQRSASATRVSLEESRVREGLGQIVLTLIRLLHELLERQAVRRMEAGTLTEDEEERLGRTLMKQSEEIDRLCAEFGVRRDDLNLDLGPIGRLL